MLGLAVGDRERAPTGRWRWALIHDDHEALDATARHVGLTLAVHADEDGSGARPSEEALARACRRKRATVRAALAVLEELGYLERHRPSRRQATRYVLTLPVGTARHPLESVPEGTNNGTGRHPSGSPPVSEWVPSGQRVGPRGDHDQQLPATDQGDAAQLDDLAVSHYGVPFAELPQGVARELAEHGAPA